MSAGLRRAARAIHRTAVERAQAAAPKPERFRVVATGPLQMQGVETDVLLHEHDDDVEVNAEVGKAPLAKGDTVWVRPEPDRTGREVANWIVTSVADGPTSGSPGGLRLRGAFTVATLPAAGVSGDIVIVTDAASGQRFKGWDGTAWKALG